jgi:hypothetical protein
MPSGSRALHIIDERLRKTIRKIFPAEFPARAKKFPAVQAAKKPTTPLLYKGFIVKNIGLGATK